MGRTGERSPSTADPSLTPGTGAFSPGKSGENASVPCVPQLAPCGGLRVSREQASRKYPHTGRAPSP